jgi:transcriptional regulator
MYVPDAFAMDDPATLAAHMAAHPFATVVTVAEGDVGVSHLPLLVDDGGHRLRGHLARENPQLSHFAGCAPLLAVFHGPHGYVSPSVYRDEQGGVPTWNYVVVHARGRGRLVGDIGLRAILNDSLSRFETTGWRPPSSDESLQSKLDAIAGFEVAVEVLEGKWKVSQNRSPADQARVAQWLERGDAASRALAYLMRGKLA